MMNMMRSCGLVLLCALLMPGGIGRIGVAEAACTVESSPGGKPGPLMKHLSLDCTSAERVANAVSAATVLKALYPAQATSFDAMLAANLSSIPAGQARSDGILLGQTIAQRELALRANDGAADVEVFTGSSAVGTQSASPR